MEGWKAKKSEGNLEAQMEKSWEILNFPSSVVPSSEYSFRLQVWPLGDMSSHLLKLFDLLAPRLFCNRDLTFQVAILGVGLPRRSPRGLFNMPYCLNYVGIFGFHWHADSRLNFSDF